MSSHRSKYGTRSLTGGTLQRRLLFAVSLALVLTTSAFTYYEISNRSQAVLAAKIEQGEALASNVCLNATSLILNEDFINIEHLLINSLHFPLFDRIVISDSDGHIISEAVSDDGIISATFRIDQIAIPTTRQTTVHQQPTHVEIHHPIVQGNELLGWTSLYLPLDFLAQVRQHVIGEALVASLLLFVVALFIAYWLLKKHLAELQRITHFALDLPQNIGSTTSCRDSSLELRTLVDALNWASEEIARDRTNIAKTNTQLEQRIAERTAELTMEKARAQDASRAKTEFLARMSHQMRTPMNAILGFSEIMLLDRGDLSPTNISNIQEIKQAGQQLMTFIDHALQLSALDRGDFTPELALHDIKPLLNRTYQAILPLAKQAKRHVDLDLDSDDELIAYTDSEALEHILENLLSNALSFTLPEGRIEIRCRKTENRSVTVSVSDTGPGFKAEEIDYLLAPFNRGTDSSFLPGLGIGLSLTKKYSALILAQLKVDSIEGKGTRIDIVLPGEKPEVGAATDHGADEHRTADVNS